MKKTFTILIAALAAILMMAQPMKGWATDGDILNETFESTSTTAGSWVMNAVSGHSGGYAQIDAGSAYQGSKGLHLGSGSNANGSATTPTLTGMTANATMTFWAKTNTNNHSLKLSATGCTIDQTSITIANGTWTQYTVNITNGTSSAVINFYKDGTTKKYIYIDDVVITSVSSGTVAAPQFNPATGSSVASGSKIYLSAAEGATIRYTSGTGTFDAPTATTGTVYSAQGITVDANHNIIKAIAIVNNVASNPATATYTVLTPKTTMDEIFAAATSAGSTATDLAITFNNWVVTGVSGSNAFVTDGTKGFIIYESGHGFEVGNILSGTVVCKVKLYKGSAELISLKTSTSGISVTTGGTVTPVTNVSIADLSGVNTGAVFSYENLSYDGTYLVDGSNNQIKPFSTLFGDLSLTSNHRYNVTGVYQQFDDTKEILPRDGNDIEDVTSGPAISVTPATLSGFTYEEGHGPSTTKTISVSGSNLTANISVSLDDNSNYEMSTTSGSDYTNSLTLNHTNGTVAATTIYVRLKAGLSLGNNYSGTITLTSTGAATTTVTLSNGSVENLSYTWDLTAASHSSASADLVTWSSSYATMTNAKGESSTAANNYLGGGNNGGYTQTRFYQNQVLSITPVPGYSLSSVVIKAVSSYVAGFTGNSWTNADASVNGTTVTITPTNVDQAVSVVISAACRATEVKVYYTANSTPTCTITFNGNGGTVGEATTYTQIVYSGTATSLNPNQFTNTNGEFSGWNTQENGSGTPYADGASITITANTTLYAQWAQSHTATVAADIEHGTVDIVGGTGDPISLTAATGTEVTLTNTPDSGYEFSSWNVYKSGDPTTTVTVTNDKFNMPDYDVIVSATFTTYVGATYTRVTTIENGRHYIIVGIDESATDKGAFAMSNDKGNNRNAAPVNITTDANGTYAQALSANVYEFVINGPDADGRYTIYDANWKATYGGYLYASSSSDNRLMTRQFNVDANSMWGIAFDNDAYATITAQGTNSRKLMRFNPGAANSDPLFNGYATTSNTGSLPYLFVKDVETQYDFYMDIAGYGNDNQVATGWNLIASPVATTPDAVTNMLANTYDLYRYNASATGAEWQNYKNDAHQNDFTITPGQGYLYANSSNVTLSIGGTPYSGTSAITMANAGWNLVGNPFTRLATVDKDFYIMNEEGSGITAPGEQTSVAPMQGIFVEATQASETVTFSTSAKGRNVNSIESVVLNLKRNNKVIDRAIARLNSDRQMTKFQLFEGDTKIYFPMEDADYAIVSSDGHGSMPVNFKAKEMGRYTISVETEGIDMSYLHLIDRLTGEDVNLLLDNEYSFIASNNDSEERFILSFTEKGYDAHGNEIFVYQSGNDLIVNGEGELQIFDVMGRMVKNTVINGVEAIAMPQGVYIFRLNENIQKIVVR